MKYLVMLGGRTIEVDLTAEPGRVTVDGKPHSAELRPVPGTPLRILILDGGSCSLPMLNTGTGTWLIQDHGERHEVEVLDERTAHIRSLAGAAVLAAGPRPLKAPMPGLVVRVEVEPGQPVVAGTSLVVLEAMKMENDLKAAAPGVVDRVIVSAGATVEKGALLVTFRP
jgi:biotin carboxyl carrier protein